MAETLKSKLLKVSSEDCSEFLIWYNDKNEKEFKKLKLPHNEEYYNEWLTSSDGIDAQMIYDKHMKNYKLSKLYNTMMNKALSGDTNAAKWVETFSKSDYFSESTDEIDDFLSGIDIPSLRG